MYILYRIKALLPCPSFLLLHPNSTAPNAAYKPFRSFPRLKKKMEKTFEVSLTIIFIIRFSKADGCSGWMGRMN